MITWNEFYLIKVLVFCDLCAEGGGGGKCIFTSLLKGTVLDAYRVLLLILIYSSFLFMLKIALGKNKKIEKKVVLLKAFYWIKCN